MFVLFVCLHLAAAEIVAKWHARVANWNTGRLYFGNGNGSNTLLYGPVCQGSGDEAINGVNGDIFGNLVCRDLGFGDAKFIGFHREYVDFMNTNSYSGYNATLFDETEYCTPDYAISGAKCNPGHKTLAQGVSSFNFTFCRNISLRARGAHLSHAHFQPIHESNFTSTIGCKWNS